MLNVSLVGNHQYTKLLFSWHLLVINVFDGVSLCYLFPTRCLGLDLELN